MTTIKSKANTITQPKLISYLKATWYARWIVIVLVGLSMWYFPSVTHKEIIVVLLLSAIGYNSLLGMGNRVKQSLLVDRPAMLFIDCLLTLILICFSGGIASPYVVILAFMIVASAYWYGSRVAILLGVIQAFTVLGNEYLIRHSKGIPGTFILQMIVFVTVGLFVGWLSIGERTERKELERMEEEIENEKNQLLTLINNIGEAILIVDTKGRVMVHNNSVVGMIGNKTILNKAIKDILTFKDTNNKDIVFDLNDLARIDDRNDLRLVANDGSIMNVNISTAPYIVAQQHKGYVLIIRDITRDKTVEQERADFIAVASHELRTPLTIAQGDVSFLLTPELMPSNPESQHMLNSALRSLKQLSRIISDLTSLAQADSEKLDVKVEPIYPVQMMTNIVADFGDQAKAKGITLMNKAEPSLDLPVILTSQYLVLEILTTLVGNAIKFTDKGSVVVSIVDNKSAGVGVTFCVSDTGLGISKSDQKKIFEKFFQSEDYMHRMHGGTGLGLYIARKLAQRLTANLWFESVLGKGSNFYLWVPSYSKDKKDQAKVASAEAKEFFNNI